MDYNNGENYWAAPLMEVPLFPQRPEFGYIGKSIKKECAAKREFVKCIKKNKLSKQMQNKPMDKIGKRSRRHSSFNAPSTDLEVFLMIK